MMAGLPYKPLIPEYVIPDDPFDPYERRRRHPAYFPNMKVRGKARRRRRQITLLLLHLYGRNPYSAQAIRGIRRVEVVQE